jgi:parvulin-like peptidyl-prolyl isomerase
VNGEPITLEEFEAELARFQDSRGTDLATQNEVPEIVIRALIERQLLVQNALSQGKVLDDKEMEQELEQLITDMGGEVSYQRWLEENHYSETTFQQALVKEMLAAKMIEDICSTVSATELHAYASHILVATQAEAEAIQQEIEAGADFAELAVLYSMDLSTRPAGGDLGWFARGTLTMPSVEEIIFQMQPGEISDVIASELGFHIVQLVGLEDRMLSYEALISKQQQAVADWLAEKWDQAEIEIFSSP